MFGEATEAEVCAALAWRPSAGSAGKVLPLVVFLHDRGRTAADAVARARALFGEGPDVLAPQAARPCNPFQSDLRSVAAYTGFSWYLGADHGRPEAASFGDALAQLDLFLRESALSGRVALPRNVDRSDGLAAAAPFPMSREVVIAGEGQGAVLALTLSLFAPEGLRGAVAIGGGLPSIDGWSMIDVRLDGLAVVLVDGPPAQLAASKATLEARGAEVEVLASLVPLERWLQSRADSRTSHVHAD